MWTADMLPSLWCTASSSLLTAALHILPTFPVLSTLEGILNFLLKHLHTLFGNYQYERMCIIMSFIDF